MKKLDRKTNYILSAIFIVIASIVLWYMEANRTTYSYPLAIMERSAIYAVVAVAMNLLTGFTGLFSLGQAGFMAIGAYTVAILTIPVAQKPAVYYINGIAEPLANASMPLWGALILGGIFAAVMGFLIGYPVLRLKSDYLAIATLGFSENYTSLYRFAYAGSRYKRLLRAQKHSRISVHLYGVLRRLFMHIPYGPGHTVLIWESI